MRIKHWLRRFPRIPGTELGNIASIPTPANGSHAPVSPIRFVADRVWWLLGARYRWITALIGICCLTLALLAYFQFVWIGQVRKVQHEAMLNSLRNAMRLFESSCQRDLSQFLAVFQSGPPTGEGAGIERDLDRYRYWRQSFHHSAVLDRVLLYDSPSPGDGQLLELNLSDRSLESANWSGHLIDLRYRLDDPALRSVTHGGDGGASTWVLFLDSAALVRAAPGHVREHAMAGSTGSSADVDYLIVLLDIHYLSEHMLPEMVDQYFAGPEGKKQYDVAVMVDGGPYFLYRVPRDRSAIFPHDMVAEGGKYFLYRSGERIDGNWLEAADSRKRLMASTHPPSGTARHLILGGIASSRPALVGSVDGPHSPSEGVAEPGEVVVNSDAQPAHPPGGGVPTRVVLADGGSLTVEIAAKHVSGSLERAVLRRQRIDLAMGFGVLIVLAIAMTFVVIASSNAARLSEMRMDFVAGVSHELRTPLSAIRTMGENMADGVVVSERKVERYGELIRDNARRLMEMVEDTLQLSAIEAGKKPFQVREVDVAAVVTEAVAHTRPMIDQAGFELVLEEGRELPLVQADRDALRQSLTNLLSNALKYGLKGRWIKVETADSIASRGREVQVRIHDRGEGVQASEARHIFEPYFRGAAAAGSVIPGSGLGLKLARDLVEGMGGKLTLHSETGRGSVFTIHLPAIEPKEA